MHRLLLTCIVLLVCGRMHASDPELDSMRMAIDTAFSDSVRVRTMLNVAELLRRRDNREALDMVAQANELSEKINDKWALAKGNLIASGIYEKLGAMDRAGKLGYDALRYFQEIDDTLELARTYISLGNMQKQTGELDLAMDSYRKGGRKYQELDRVRGVAIARFCQASLLAELNRTDEALALYRSILQEDSIQTPILIASTYNNIGNVYREGGSGDSAIYYFKMSLEIKRNLGYSGTLANTYNNIAAVHLENQDYDLAKVYLDSASGLVMQSGLVERQMEHFKYQSQWAAAKGLYRQAYEFAEKRIMLNDSFLNKERAQRISELNAAYDAEAKQAEIDLLNQEKAFAASERSRFQAITIGLTGGVVLLVVLFIVTILRNRERNRASNELLKKSLEIERQKAEILEQNQELQEQNQRLEELNHEKDGLIGIVAHDIRAPLNRSAALAELIGSVGPLTDEQRKFVDMIGKVSDDGGRLIQDLLELNAYERKDARIDWGKTEANEVLQHSSSAFDSRAVAKNLSIELQLSNQPCPIRTDEKLLTRILDNLISNAVKFTHAGKRIFLSVEADHSKVAFVIRDEGQGISEADQKKMFRKFQRLSARPTGGESSTGLGLSIVKTLVERLHGALEVESELGIGTTFTVIIPREPDVEDGAESIREKQFSTHS